MVGGEISTRQAHLVSVGSSLFTVASPPAVSFQKRQPNAEYPCICLAWFEVIPRLRLPDDGHGEKETNGFMDTGQSLAFIERRSKVNGPNSYPVGPRLCLPPSVSLVCILAIFAGRKVLFVRLPLTFEAGPLFPILSFLCLDVPD